MSNDLPPLPEPDIAAAHEYFLIDGSRQRDGYTADQMRAYAMQERAAERARHRYDVHSCHQGCAVAGCVNERLRAELAEAKRALQQAVLDERERWAAAARLAEYVHKRAEGSSDGWRIDVWISGKPSMETIDDALRRRSR